MRVIERTLAGCVESIQEDKTKRLEAHFVSHGVEAHKRCLLRQAQHRLSHSSKLRLTFLCVFRQMSSFLALIDNDITDAILIIC